MLLSKSDRLNSCTEGRVFKGMHACFSVELHVTQFVSQYSVWLITFSGRNTRCSDIQWPFSNILPLNTWRSLQVISAFIDVIQIGLRTLSLITHLFVTHCRDIGLSSRNFITDTFITCYAQLPSR